jgi:uroporphyrinogen-III decarboxylase
VEHWLADIQRMLEAGVDVIVFADDWGTQTAPIISPALFRRVFKPRYATMMAPVRQAGRKVFFHCCGWMRGILNELIDLGIEGLWPQIGLFEADPQNLALCREHRVTIYIHPDRQRLIPLGTPAEIDAAVQRYAERYHAQGGGGIFYVEIENDAPFANVEALVLSVDKWR